LTAVVGEFTDPHPAAAPTTRTPTASDRVPPDQHQSCPSSRVIEHSRKNAPPRLGSMSPAMSIRFAFAGTTLLETLCFCLSHRFDICGRSLPGACSLVMAGPSIEGAHQPDTQLALSRAIRLRREEIVLTQEALADAADLDATSIHGLERGERGVANPTWDIVDRPARALGLGYTNSPSATTNWRPATPANHPATTAQRRLSRRSRRHTARKRRCAVRLVCGLHGTGVA
jgi:transcriptional regulator with XRE-family HTH domain